MAGDLEENNWKDSLKQRFPKYFDGVKVLDIGSADINGTNKSWFNNSEYIGLDVLPYNNVDVVSIAHEYDAPKWSFDTICSTSELEHDMYWQKTLLKMVELLKPGGLLWFACAAERGEHGTKTHNPDDSLTVKLDDEEWNNYYRNIREKDVRNVLDLDKIFSEYEIGYSNDKAFLKFWGIKPCNLDIGAGTKDEWVEGDWVRVDAYVDEADIKAPAWKLPFHDNWVDSIWSSHTLEHVSKRMVVPTLKEWYRVLKPNGKLTLRVPDFAWCCQWWLDHQTNTWDMDIIYGGQTRQGEYHKTGFNREIAINYLQEAGFKVEKFEELDTHSQRTMSFDCIK